MLIGIKKLENVNYTIVEYGDTIYGHHLALKSNVVKITRKTNNIYSGIKTVVVFAMSNTKHLYVYLYHNLRNIK